MKKTMAFSIDEIALANPYSKIFTVTLIPDINTSYYAPLHLRSVNVYSELLEEPFYDAIMNKHGEFGENSNWPKPEKFISSVVQGAYYKIDKHIIPDDVYHPETIIGPEDDFFREGLQAENPYRVFQQDRGSMNIKEAIPLISNSDKGSGDALYIYGLYVGQGDSLLMVCPNGSVYLIDTNYYWINNPDILAEINRILDNHNLPRNQIKAMIITHQHLDHIRGAWEFLKQFNIEYFLMNYDYEHFTKPVQLLRQSAIENIMNRINVNGPAIIMEGRVSIAIKNPDSDTRDRASAPDINDSSIAIDVEYMGHHVYLTGDAGYPVICSRFDENRRSGNVLKVSHHGSRTGTNQDVIDRLNPAYCYISAGNHKRFNHPHDEILEMINRGKSFLTISKKIRRTVCYRLSSDGTNILPF